jgi:hypothetical protein
MAAGRVALQRFPAALDLDEITRQLDMGVFVHSDRDPREARFGASGASGAAKGDADMSRPVTIECLERWRCYGE